MITKKNMYTIYKLMKGTTEVLPSHLKAYVDAGKHIDAIHPKCKTTLLNYFISEKPNLKNVMAIVRLGADIEKRNVSGTPPLFYSILHGTRNNFEITRFLIRAGADVNAKDKFGVYVLMRCVPHAYYLGALRLLLNAGADMEVRCSYNRTVLQYAISTDTSKSIIRELINAGANINAPYRKSTTFFYAIKQGCSIDIMKTFIEAGIDMTRKNTTGETILTYILTRGRGFELIKYIINNGANVNTPDKGGYTPLMIAVIKLYNADVIKFLIEAGANLDAICHDGRTVLMQCILDKTNKNTYMHEERIKMLIDNSKNINIRDSRGDNALMYLVKNDRYYPCAINSLIAVGIDMNNRNVDGETPLIHVLKNVSCNEIVMSLIEHGTDVNIKDNWGRSALIYTVLHKPSNRILEALIKAGADVNAIRYSGETVLDIARKHALVRKKSNTPREQILIKAGAKTYSQLYKIDKT